MKVINVFFASAMLAAMTACNSNENVFDGRSLENETKQNFTKSFIAKYPQVSLAQNWDLSSQSSSFTLANQETRATRDANQFSVTKKVYEVDTDFLKWLQKELPGTDARSKGKPFYMTVPSSNFSIIPVFQNTANGIWDLHMVVDGVDIKVWSKSEDMYIQSAQYKEWKALKDIPQELKNGVYKDQSRNTLKATAVKAPEFYFSNMPTGKTISFYLELTATTSMVHNVGDKLGSLTGNMISLDATDHRPDNIDASKQVSVIACEDGRAEKADWSLNDVIFLVVGDPDAPHSVNLVDGTPVVEKRQVRYMIEDLGSTNDFDFNDIVVDVEQSRTTTPILKTITDKNGKQIEWLTGWKEEPYAQKAIIRHLGGTLPFKLYIGDTEISEVSPSMDSNPDTEFTVTGWNPENHNVSVAVQQKNSNGMYYNTVPFPKEGEAPMIIATNTNLQWMKERVSIPAEWFIDNRTDEE